MTEKHTYGDLLSSHRFLRGSNLDALFDPDIDVPTDSDSAMTMRATAVVEKCRDGCVVVFVLPNRAVFAAGREADDTIVLWGRRSIVV